MTDCGAPSQIKARNHPPSLKSLLTLPVNSTLSIDISKSWTTKNVTIRTIHKPGPAKANVVLWKDEAAGVFYSWGGKFPNGRNITANPELWKFTADGNGGGSWSLVDAGTRDLPSAEDGAWTSTPDTGFVVGGIVHGYTRINFHGQLEVLTGMMTFNLKKPAWSSGTVGFSPLGANGLVYTSAEYVPVFGPNGIIMLFGGYSPPTPPLVADFSKSYGRPIDMENLTFFDPVTKQAFWQKTTGTIPTTPRGEFCAVGFPTNNGGFDMSVSFLGV